VANDVFPSGDMRSPKGSETAGLTSRAGAGVCEALDPELTLPADVSPSAANGLGCWGPEAVVKGDSPQPLRLGAAPVVPSLAGVLVENVAPTAEDADRPGWTVGGATVGAAGWVSGWVAPSPLAWNGSAPNGLAVTGRPAGTYKYQ
jgi:hypothetical protein